MLECRCFFGTPCILETFVYFLSGFEVLMRDPLGAFSRSRFLHSCNPYCHTTIWNQSVKLISLSEKMYEFWINQCGFTDKIILCFRIFLLQFLPTFYQKYLHHQVHCGVVYQIKVINLNSIFIKKYLKPDLKALYNIHKAHGCIFKWFISYRHSREGYCAAPLKWYNIQYEYEPGSSWNNALIALVLLTCLNIPVNH